MNWLVKIIHVFIVKDVSGRFDFVCILIVPEDIFGGIRDVSKEDALKRSNLAERRCGDRTQTLQPKVRNWEKSSGQSVAASIGEVSWCQPGIVAFLSLR